MKRKLFFKFLIVYLVCAVVSFLLISVAGSALINRTLEERASKNMYTAAQKIAPNYAGTQNLDSQTVYNTMSATALFMQARILILDPNGKIYLDTGQPYTEQTQDTLKGFDATALSSGYYTIGNFYGLFSEDTVSVVVPISTNMKTRGYVSIHMPLSTISAEKESLLSTTYLICCIIYGMSLVVFVLMQFWIYRPLNVILKGARKMAAGDLTSKIDLHSKDELGALAETLNYMGSEINKSTEYQHQFISNVSHDFRSPLTSIKGYVEAIRDGVIPPESQNRYLDIVVSETKRLEKLTRELLSLDNIDSHAHELSCSKFNINQLIRDTLLTFEGRCHDKGIRFTLLLDEDPLDVHADHGRIQQVMYNLIDNAIKFSNANSEIQIETSRRREKAYICVKDHGVGISSKDLGKIWQRFYKTDSSRGKDRTGTGLGLAIVRDIIDAHGQKITAISTEGVGTEFTFTLNLAAEE